MYYAFENDSNEQYTSREHRHNHSYQYTDLQTRKYYISKNSRQKHSFSSKDDGEKNKKKYSYYQKILTLVGIEEMKRRVVEAKTLDKKSIPIHSYTKRFEV